MVTVHVCACTCEHSIHTRLGVGTHKSYQTVGSHRYTNSGRNVHRFIWAIYVHTCIYVHMLLQAQRYITDVGDVQVSRLTLRVTIYTEAISLQVADLSLLVIVA